MNLAVPIELRAPKLDSRRPIGTVATVLAAVAGTVVAAAIAATNASAHPAAVAAARAAMVAIPVAVGLYASYRRPAECFGSLLVLAGAVSFAATLGESSDSVPYTVGRIAGWLVPILMVYLFLSFPSGRLYARIDRLLVGAIALVVLTTFVARLPFTQSFELPSPWTSCVSDCPTNALFLADREPAFVDGVMRPLGAALTLAIMIAVVVRLYRRHGEATPLTRRMFAPVVAISVACAAVLGLGIVYRRLVPDAATLKVVVWILALAIPAVALAFFAGLVRLRFFGARALAHIAACIRTMPDAVTLRRAFVEAFGDRTIQIAFPQTGAELRWMDPWGRAVALPEPGSGRHVTQVRDRGEILAVIVHDEALCAEPELVRAGASMAAVVLDNHRLAVDADRAMHEVSRSRRRIAATAERERRRIERDLHDGAQQRLVALRIELGLAEDVVRRDPDEGVEYLRQLEHEVDEALDELRALAHGVYPPLLADRGLAEALRAVAARYTLPVDLEARGVERYAPEVESAVYFCVLEALQNVLKHAQGARRVHLSLDGSVAGELRFSVRDDGAGAPRGRMEPGAGLTNMQDRVAAFGGEVSVRSTPRVGTVVSGRVPASSLSGV